MAARKARSFARWASKVLIRSSSGSWARVAWIESRSVWVAYITHSSGPR